MSHRTCLLPICPLQHASQQIRLPRPNPTTPIFSPQTQSPRTPHQPTPAPKVHEDLLAEIKALLRGPAGFTSVVQSDADPAIGPGLYMLHATRKQL